MLASRSVIDVSSRLPGGAAETQPIRASVTHPALDGKLRLLIDAIASDNGELTPDGHEPASTSCSRRALPAADSPFHTSEVQQKVPAGSSWFLQVPSEKLKGCAAEGLALWILRK